MIEKLVTEGNSVNAYPFRLLWLKSELKTSYACQVAITVSKKNFKRAVDRNRIKRLMREVYRMNKATLHKTLTNKNMQCALLLMYTGKIVLDYNGVEKKLKLTLQRFEEAIIAGSG